MERPHDLAPNANGHTVPKEATLATSKMHKAAIDFIECMVDDTLDEKIDNGGRFKLCDDGCANYRNSGTSFVLSRQPSEAQEKEAFDGSQDIKIHFMVSWSTGSNGSP